MTLQHEPHPIPADTFANRLVLLRHDRGLTQAQAAERCGLDDGSWSNWENGTQPRGLARIVEKIATGLAADRDWLMWGGALYQDSSSLRWITTSTESDETDAVVTQCDGQLALIAA